MSDAGVLRISELTPGTPPYPPTTLLEVSVPNGGPSGYSTFRAMLGDLFEGMLISDSVLAGNTTLPGSGVIASDGKLGVRNPAPTADLTIGLTSATARSYNATAGADTEFAYMGDWSSNVVRYGSDRSGAGLARDVSLVRGGVEQIRLTSAGPALTTPNIGAATGTSATLSGALSAGSIVIGGELRGAANRIEIRNGVIAQGARVYNTYTDASNSEFAYLGDWLGSVVRLGSDQNGTGIARDVSLVRGGVELLRLGATGVETGARIWVTRTYPVDDNWSDVAFGNGLFVAVAGATSLGQRLMTSPDGVRWTERTTPNTNNIGSIAYGNGLFVAVEVTGVGNRVITSSNGITWTARASSADSTWNSVVYGKGLFVAAASSGTGTDLVMTSPDGINWTTRVGVVSQWSGLAYGNGLFVAVATSGTDRIMTSPDGVNWTARTAPQANLWRSVVYANGLFVAVASSGTDRVMTSPDGITWTLRTVPTNGWFAVTYGAGLFVAVAQVGTGRVMTSPDGINWTTRPAAVEANEWVAVAYGNGLFVALARTGTGNRVMTSGAQIEPNLALSLV